MEAAGAAVFTAVASEVASQTTSEVAETFIGSVKREICYVFKYKSFISDLENQVKELEFQRQRVKQAVEHAERQGEEIFDDVKAWLVSEEGFTGTIAKRIIDDDDEGLCVCPNLLKRYSLGKKAVEAAEEGANLMGKGRSFSTVSYSPAPERPVVKLGRSYQEFDSRMSIFQEIMELLKDSNVDMIGVYGMGGVGKTTLVKQVARQVIEDKLLFDEVVMAEATQTPDPKVIQDKIARDLGFEFKQYGDVFQRAEQLRQRMKKVKRILVIVDNIWTKLDLDALGIPSADDVKERKDDQTRSGDDVKERKDDQIRCTILLTSRSQYLLCNDMNSPKNFSVEVLSKEESGQLFEKIVCDSAQNSDFQPIANEIVERCGGLPVALNTIANVLKNKSLPIWKAALDQLRSSNPREIHGMHANVYSSIELSYKFLESDEAKSLFLLCSLYSAGHSVKVLCLLRYGMGLGLFNNVYTLEAGRNRVHMLIDNLKASCLLLDGDAKDEVKMHDIIHFVAVSVATKNLMFNIPSAADLKEEIEKIIQKGSTAISLPYRDVYELPERLGCFQLEFFLFLANYGSSFEIADLFFEGMEQLKVLHISTESLFFLPSSLGCLINLKTLCLDGCQLMGIAIVGQLKGLEILSFQDCSIEVLPVEIGELKRLRLLDLSNCPHLEFIAPNVISKLSRLEELYMGCSFTGWEKIGGGGNASLVELKGLLKLTTLDIDIPDAQTMPQDFVSAELERFSIAIGGGWWDRYHKYETSRLMKLKRLEKSILLGSYGMKMLLKRTEDLSLEELKGYENVVHELDDGEGFPQLKHLHVEGCSEVLHIVSSVGRVHCKVFPLLESLSLHSLISLEKVCHGQLTEDQSFSNLRIIKVEECDRLEHLFSFSMAKNLMRLQKVKVTNSNSLKMIVGTDIEKPTTSTLRFKEIIAEDDLDEKVIFPSLEELKLHSSHGIEKLWPDQFRGMSTSFICCQNLKKLTVVLCCGLKYLFSYSMVNTSLLQLQHLEISHCSLMEGVVDTMSTGLGRGEGKLIEVIFPKLNYLKLCGLPQLTSFAMGHIHSLEFPSLLHLEIDDSPNLRRFVSMNSSEDNIHTDKQPQPQPQPQPLFDERVRLPSLEVLKITWMSNLRKVWHHPIASDSFTKLKNLEIRRCDDPMNIFPPTVGTSSSLVNLSISNCEEIEEIIGLGGEKVKENRIAFSKLKLLELHGLPRLTSFCMENYTLEFSSLERVSVINCPNMKTFSNGVSWTPKLYKVQVMPEKEGDALSHWEGNLDSTIQKLFEEMVGFRYIDELKLSNFPHLREIWHGHALPVSYFNNLKELVVDDCTNMSSAIPAKLLRCLNNLRILKVRNCDLLEEVLHLEELNADEEFLGPLFPKLRNLELKDLPKLKRFCNFTKHIIELPELLYLWIENCPNMETFVSNSTSVHLTANKESQEMTSESEENFLLAHMQSFFDDKVALPKLITMTIKGMDSLRKIWQDQLTLDSFCVLQSLIVEHCDKLLNMFPWNMLERLRNLYKLEILSCESIQEIFELRTPNCGDTHFITASDQLTETIPASFVFPELTQLALGCLPRLKSFYQEVHISEWPKLEWLIMLDCPEVEILASEFLTLQGNHAADGQHDIKIPQYLFSVDKDAFPRLEALVLYKLPHLLHLWKGISQPSKVFQNLEKLEVSECGKLEELQPSSESFQNLTTLDVSECDGLLTLLTHSTAESLVKLRRVKITDCKNIENIIQQIEVKEDCIVFSQLEYLCLHCLPSLACFCLGNYTLGFSSLKQLVVRECPEMITFSQGVLNTPMLHKVQVQEEEEDEGRWEGNLNSTIQQLFKEINERADF